MALMVVWTVCAAWQVQEYRFLRMGLGYSKGFDPTRIICLSIPPLGALSLTALYFEIKRANSRISLSSNPGAVVTATAVIYMAIKCCAIVCGNVLKKSFVKTYAIENPSFATALTPRLTETGVCVMTAWFIMLIGRDGRPLPRADLLQRFEIALGISWVTMSVIREVTAINFL